MKLSWLVVLFIVLITGGVIAGLSNYEKKVIDCNKPFDVIYLKPSEINYASKLVDRINGIVVIPELNQLIARTDILNCENFDINNYINLEKDNGLI